MRPDVEPRGEIVWDPLFNLSSTVAQEALLHLCEALQAAPCEPGGVACLEGFGTLVVPGSVRCPTTYFYASQDVTIGTNHSLSANHLQGAAFDAAMFQWVTDRVAIQQAVEQVDGPGSYDVRPLVRDAGFVSGELKYIRIGFLAPLSETAVFEQPTLVARYYEELEAFSRAFMANAPRELGTCTQETGGVEGFIDAHEEHPMTKPQCSGLIPFMDGPGDLGSFAIGRTTDYMVTGLMSGLAVSTPSTFGVLLLATGSPLISLYAMLTIVLVVASLFAFISTFFGWQLGHAEAIAGTIVLGFAIDYCVHLAHAYLTSQEKERGGKARESLARMGNTVLAGAVTTIGSGIAMAMCQANVYHKMGILICLTIVFSCLYALLFFAPLCAIIGPTAPPWRYSVIVDNACGLLLPKGSMRLSFGKRPGSGQTATRGAAARAGGGGSGDFADADAAGRFAQQSQRSSAQGLIEILECIVMCMRFFV